MYIFPQSIAQHFLLARRGEKRRSLHNVMGIRDCMRMRISNGHKKNILAFRWFRFPPFMVFRDNKILCKNYLRRARKSRSLYPPIIYCANSSRTQVSLSRKDYYRRCYEVPTSIPLAEPKLNLLCFMQYGKTGHKSHPVWHPVYNETHRH